ncbi:hypothetical protein [Galbibacter sp.]|uniref:hypothetical protein n=1 Tax=Galbibacter sp. TaxID=2918471 RepID=UPI003A8EDF56
MDSPIKYLIQGVFQKAKEESGQTSINSCCNHLEGRFREDFKCYEGTSSRSFTRLHKKYIEESHHEKAAPKAELLDAMSRYLGHKDYQDFLISQGNGKKSSSSHSSFSNARKKPNRERIIILFIGLVIGSLLGYKILTGGTGSQPSPECMIWNQTHFEKISCELSLNIEKAGKIIGFDATLFSSMKMIPENEVRVGDSYYYKVGRDSIQYFSWYGKHPLKGEDLKPVTDYIIGKYINP